MTGSPGVARRSRRGGPVTAARVRAVVTAVTGRRAVVMPTAGVVTAPGVVALTRRGPVVTAAVMPAPARRSPVVVAPTVVTAPSRRRPVVTATVVTAAPGRRPVTVPAAVPTPVVGTVVAGDGVADADDVDAVAADVHRYVDRYLDVVAGADTGRVRGVSAGVRAP